MESKEVKKRLKSFRNRLTNHTDWYDCLSYDQKELAYQSWLRYKKIYAKVGKKAKIKNWSKIIKETIKPKITRKRDVLINKIINND